MQEVWESRVSGSLPDYFKHVKSKIILPLNLHLFKEENMNSEHLLADQHLCHHFVREAKQL